MKAFQLISSLSEKDVELLRKNESFLRGKSYPELLRLLRKAAKAGADSVKKDAICKILFKEKYHPAMDNKMRSVLKRFSGVVEDFLVEREMMASVKRNKSKYYIHLLQALLNREQLNLFDTTYKSAFLWAEKNHHLQQLMEIQELMYHRQLALGPINQKVLQLVKPQVEVTAELAKRLAIQVIQQAQRTGAYVLSGAGLPKEDQTVIPPQFMKALAVDDENLMSPPSAYAYYQAQYFFQTDPKERVATLYKLLDILDECQVEDYPYAKNKINTLLNLAVVHLYNSDYQLCYKLTEQAGELTLEYEHKVQFRLVHCGLISLLLLNRHKEALKFSERYQFKGESAQAKLIINQDLAYAHLYFGNTGKVRELIKIDDHDSGDTILSKRTVLVCCLIEERNLLTAINECDNLYNTLMGRAKKGTYEYSLNSIGVIKQYLKILSSAPDDKGRQLSKLRAQVSQILEKPQLSVSEMFTLNWVKLKLG